MEEAQALSDKIAIMRKGKLAALGSTLELRSTFGAGYKLTVSKNEEANDQQIFNFVGERIRESKVLESSEAELKIELPYSSVPQFAVFFNELEQNLAKLSVKTFGISVTTLEEIFIKISEGEEIENQD